MTGSGWIIAFDQAGEEYQLEISEEGTIDLVLLDEEQPDGRLVVEQVQAAPFKEEPQVFLSGTRLSVVNGLSVYKLKFFEKE